MRERERIVLSDFENHTAIPELGAVITEAFRIDLSQSPFLRVAEPSFILQVLRRMERDPGQPLDVALARELAVREGLAVVIGGEVAVVGGSYLISTAIISAESGEVLAGFRESAADSTGILTAVDRLSRALREHIGESVRSIRRSKPLKRVTTGSLHALRKYSEAYRALAYTAEYDKAVALFEEAIALDSGFAAAYVGHAMVLWNRGELVRSYEAITKAYQLREHLTDPERYRAIAEYHRHVMYDRSKAITAYERLLDIHPADVAALNNVAILYLWSRDFARAEDYFLRAILADSAVWQPYGNAMEAQGKQGKFDEAEATLVRAARNAPDPDFAQNATTYYRVWLASARGDYSTAREHIQLREARDAADRSWPGFREWRPRQLARLAAVQGRVAKAHAHWQDAMAAAAERGRGKAYLELAVEDAQFDLWPHGRPAAAVQRVESALERFPLDSLAPFERPYVELNPNNRIESGLIPFFALAGQLGHARQLVGEYQTVVAPRLSKRHESSLHGARGVIALAEGHAEAAITELRAWDRGTSCAYCALPYLGKAHYMAGALDSTIAIYERYVTTPGLFRLATDCFHLPLVYERLGALYAQQGDTTKAIYYYGKFVDLWKEADPELQPRVEAARQAIGWLAEPAT